MRPRFWVRPSGWAWFLLLTSVVRGATIMPSEYKPGEAGSEYAEPLGAVMGAAIWFFAWVVFRFFAWVISLARFARAQAS